MGYLYSEHIVKFVKNKRITTLDNDGYIFSLHFDDGTSLRLFCNYGLTHQDDGSYKPHGEIIATPYKADGEVCMYGEIMDKT